MTDFHFESEYNPNFIGRENELKWFDEHLFHRNPSFTPIVVSGPPGVGKTALVKQWFSSRGISYTPLLLDLSSQISKKALDDLLRQIHAKREQYLYGNGLAVIIDGTDIWTAKQHQEAAGKIFNYKAVSTLIFIRRKPLKLSLSQQLQLHPLSSSSTEDLVRILLNINLADDQIQNAILLSKGIPLAISVLSRLIKGENVSSILSTPKEPLYHLSNNILVPKKDIIRSVTPVMVSANHQLISSLKTQPKDLHKLASREFEKLLADLLQDMGWEVELTKQTRDGGSDILAYLNTDIGRLLCLVEAKRYREDRKIGVDLVRTLYGTLCDAQANSAMMVTTSSFTDDAKTFQQRHKYQLALKDYGDVVEWILKFGSKVS